MPAEIDGNGWIARMGRSICKCPVTLGLTALMILLNWGLSEMAPELMQKIPALLEYDRTAIADGEIWRLISGNLVHWSVEHACLDVGAFAIVGWMFERRLRGIYAPLLIASGLCVGLALWLGEPQLERYRGFSGVNSAQFAAVVLVELRTAWRTPRRWLWVAPAAGIFLVKIVSECATGTMFFGTESLGDIGMPVPMSHAAGALSGASLAIIVCALDNRAQAPTTPATAPQLCQNCDSRGPS